MLGVPIPACRFCRATATAVHRGTPVCKEHYDQITIVRWAGEYRLLFPQLIKTANEALAVARIRRILHVTTVLSPEDAERQILECLINGFVPRTREEALLPVAAIRSAQVALSSASGEHPRAL